MVRSPGTSVSQCARGFLLAELLFWVRSQPRFHPNSLSGLQDHPPPTSFHQLKARTELGAG